jgi:ABC-2 type transport system ATP-binding protein
MQALRADHVSKTYSNGTTALKDVTLSIEEGDFFALLGANGAGKTTFIGIMTSLVNKSGGALEIFGHDIDRAPNEAKKMLGIVPQEFNFNMFEKVLDIVVDQAGYYGIPRSVALPRAHELLDALDLSAKKDVTARTLSGGMKRRLMIARALVHRPRMLILDEPTAGVDVELRHGMWKYLTRLNQEEGVTIVLTTHYLEEVEQLCRNAAFIREGTVVLNGTVKSLLSHQQNTSYRIETEPVASPLPSDRYGLRLVDETTVEATLSKADTINDLVKTLTENGVTVKNINPK